MLKKSKDAGNIPTLGNSRFEERSAVQRRSKEIDRFPLEQGGLFLFAIPYLFFYTNITSQRQEKP